MAIERGVSSEHRVGPARTFVSRPILTPEERVHRQQTWNELLRFRAEVGPIKGVTTADLLDRRDDSER